MDIKLSDEELTELAVKVVEPFYPFGVHITSTLPVQTSNMGG